MTMQDPYSLGGKAAIVVGSASGIGRAIALEVARAGASVVYADLDESGARETARAIIEAGGNAVAIRCDVSSEPQAEAPSAEAYRTFRRVDVLRCRRPRGRKYHPRI
jgi:NAD(P)-dependent dehydrogenase (short-subunit alcohol dehydrogenase family)